MELSDIYSMLGFLRRITCPSVIRWVSLSPTLLLSLSLTFFLPPLISGANSQKLNFVEVLMISQSKLISLSMRIADACRRVVGQTNEIKYHVLCCSDGTRLAIRKAADILKL